MDTWHSLVSHHEKVYKALLGFYMAKCHCNCPPAFWEQLKYSYNKLIEKKIVSLGEGAAKKPEGILGRLRALDVGTTNKLSRLLSRLLMAFTPWSCVQLPAH